MRKPNVLDQYKTSISNSTNLLIFMNMTTNFIHIKIKGHEALYEHRLTTSINTNISNPYVFLKAGKSEFYAWHVNWKYSRKRKETFCQS